MKARLQTSLGQQLVMTPQLRQAIRLLQMSSTELELELAEAVESNPLLEWADEAAPGEPAGEADASPAAADAGDRERRQRGPPQRDPVARGRLVQLERVHQGEGRQPVVAHLRRGAAELAAERAGKGGMRGITAVQRELQDVVAALGQAPRGQGQPPAAQVTHQRGTGTAMEHAGQMERRQPHRGGDIRQRQRAIVMAFDVPQHFCRCAQGASCLSNAGKNSGAGNAVFSSSCGACRHSIAGATVTPAICTPRACAASNAAALGAKAGNHDEATSKMARPEG